MPLLNIWILELGDIETNHTGNNQTGYNIANSIHADLSGLRKGTENWVTDSPKPCHAGEREEKGQV